MTPRPLRVAASVTSIVALVAGGVAATSGTAQAAGFDLCPDAFPAADLTPGQEATGLTTAGYYEDSNGVHDSRTTPEEFTGKYIGTIEDASGDLFVFQTAGSRITKPSGELDAGIWSGMSGSPLYAEDGRLIGAVSYTFGEDGASEYAGVTPAADMYALLDTPTLAGRKAAPKTVALSSTEKKSLAKQGVPQGLAADGLKRLDPTVTTGGLKGLKSTSLDKIAKKAGRPAPRFVGGGATSNVDIPVTPGSNLAAADSYGSVAAYGVGTTTAVCGDQVLAFGHPYDFAPSSKTVHGASTTFIQAAGAYSFKMTNIGAPSGTLTKDGLNGILGRLGAVPTYPTIQSTTNGTTTKASESTVPNPDALPYIIANQAYRDAVLSLDQDSKGSATVGWTINFTPESGVPQDFTRSQRYSSAYSIGEEVTNDVAGDVDTILSQDFENVTINSVTFTDDVSADYKAYKIGAVDLSTGNKWVPQKNNAQVLAKAGKHLRLRVHLEKASKTSTVTPTTKVIDYTVSKFASGPARVSINGNAFSFDDFEEFGLTFCDDEEDEFCDDEEEEDTSPKNLTEVLAELKSQPRQDTATSVLAYSSGSVAKRGFSAAATVEGSFGLRVVFIK